VTVYGYMAVLPARHWGERWIETGEMSARFLKPVYDGDEVAVAASPAGSGLDLELRDSAGEGCASGHAQASGGEPPPRVQRYPSRPDHRHSPRARLSGHWPHRYGSSTTRGLRASPTRFWWPTCSCRPGSTWSRAPGTSGPYATANPSRSGLWSPGSGSDEAIVSSTWTLSCWRSTRSRSLSCATWPSTSWLSCG